MVLQDETYQLKMNLKQSYKVSCLQIMAIDMHKLTNKLNNDNDHSPFIIIAA